MASKILLGLNQTEKQSEISRYVEHNEIKKVYCFSFPRFWLPREQSDLFEQIQYSDIIMYKFFYRLLEEIDDHSLIVVNECLRTQNRNDLTYNCLHHYLNQTPHRLIFEYFPFIEDKQDFMTLMDFSDRGRYRGHEFSEDYLLEADIRIKPHRFNLEVIDVPTTPDMTTAYNKKRDALFDGLGKKDPDTIPRNLHLFAGTYKKPHIESDQKYVARNSRFGKDNITVYKEITSGNYTIIDFPYRRIDFNDFLKASGMHDLRCISTDLKIDRYYIDWFNDWKRRLDEFYGMATGIYAP